MMVEEMMINTERFIQLFSEAVDHLIPDRTTMITEDEAQSAEEILAQHRKANMEIDGYKGPIKAKSRLPPEITRN